MNDDSASGRTATGHVRAALEQVAAIWDAQAEHSGRTSGEFYRELFPAIYETDESGDELTATLTDEDGTPQLRALMLCVVFACEAMKLEERGEIEAAWNAAMPCAYWLGVLLTTKAFQDGSKSQAVQFGHEGADITHKEHRELRASALDWYAKHKHEVASKDAAADRMARELVPVRSRTIRNWLKGC